MGGYANHGGVGPFFGEKDKTLKEERQRHKDIQAIQRKVAKIMAKQSKKR